MRGSWARTVVTAGAGAALLAACGTVPTQPRYGVDAPVRADLPPPVAEQRYEPEPPPATAAPSGSITGSSLAPLEPPRPRADDHPYDREPATREEVPRFDRPPPPASDPTGDLNGAARDDWRNLPPDNTPEPPVPFPSADEGLTYEVQPGDTLSGVARRFATPVRVLIALNGLGDEGRVRVAQRLILPDSAVDQGRDPYATGPAPERTEERVSGSLPPPPGPPVEDRPRRPAQTETYLPNPPARQPEVQPAPRLPRPAPPTASTEGDRVYVVQPGDALSGVARRFGAPVQSLMDLNGLDPRGGVRAGQRLVLPEGARDSGPDPLATGATPAGVPGAIGGPRQSAPSGEARPADRRPTTSTTRPPAATGDGFPDAAELRRQAGGRFAWPVRGDITARFGTQGVGLRSDGIDISGPAGGQVRAAAPGTVAFAGPVVGAGNTVVIDHGANWVSVYSNLGSADVRMERRVEQGDVVGRAGSGAVASPVHFEIRYRTSQRERARPVDPLPLLP